MSWKTVLFSVVAIVAVLYFLGGGNSHPSKYTTVQQITEAISRDGKIYIDSVPQGAGVKAIYRLPSGVEDRADLGVTPVVIPYDKWPSRTFEITMVTILLEKQLKSVPGLEAIADRFEKTWKYGGYDPMGGGGAMMGSSAVSSMFRFVEPISWYAGGNFNSVVAGTITRTIEWPSSNRTVVWFVPHAVPMDKAQALMGKGSFYVDDTTRKALPTEVAAEGIRSLERCGYYQFLGRQGFHRLTVQGGSVSMTSEEIIPVRMR